VANLFKIEQNKTLLRDPNKTALAGCKHEAEASRAGHIWSGEDNPEQSRRASATSQPGGETFVRWDELSLRQSPLFDSSELSNVDDCVGAIVAPLNTAELGVRVGLVFFS
jgi:hypothetical protein